VPGSVEFHINGLFYQEGRVFIESDIGVEPVDGEILCKQRRGQDEHQERECKGNKKSETLRRAKKTYRKGNVQGIEIPASGLSFYEKLTFAGFSSTSGASSPKNSSFWNLNEDATILEGKDSMRVLKSRTTAL